MSIVLDGTAGITTNSGTVVSTTDATLNGLTVGEGGGSISTNTAVGVSALGGGSQTGVQNTSVGYQTMLANTSGSYNSAFGHQAMKANTTGEQNTAFGREALLTNTTGNFNAASGMAALRVNTTGSNNTAFGFASLYQNTTSSNNTAVGYQALYSKTGGSTDGNVSVGYQAGYSSTTSTTNTFIGVQAGYYNTTGNSNVMIGSNAGALSVNATTGDGNVYIGGGVRGSAAGNTQEIVIGYLTTGKGSNTGFINPNSGGVFQGNNSAAWSVASDQRLKKNIVDNTEGLDIITQIRVRNFEYRIAEEVTELPTNQAIEKQGIQLGVIAQELQQVCGDCVKTESTGVLSVDTSNLTWHMINAIKDLKTIVDAQAAEIAELKAKVA
jgi:hypothetical protein